MLWFWKTRKAPIDPEWEDVIGAYGTVLENNRPGIGGSLDESVLPFDKDIIKRALIRAVRQDGLPGEMVNALGVAYISLAKFRIGGGGREGPKPTIDELRNMTREELTDFARQWASSDDAAIAESIMADTDILMSEWEAAITV